VLIEDRRWAAVPGQVYPAAPLTDNGARGREGLVKGVAVLGAAARGRHVGGGSGPKRHRERREALAGAHTHPPPP
jgi:hypothetical protein